MTAPKYKVPDEEILDTIEVLKLQIQLKKEELTYLELEVTRRRLKKGAKNL